MTPAVGYTEMKDSGISWIGKIPSNWVVNRIKNHFRIITGNGFPVELQGQAEGDYPVCKASDISNASKIICKAANYIHNDTVNSQHFNIIPAGSILLPKIGEAMKKNSRAICAMDCCVDNNCQGLVPLHFNSTYGYYLLSCIDMRWFDNAGTIPCVNNQKLKDCKIPCPDAREQSAIAAYLDSQCAKIDEIIAEAKASIEDYQQWKASIIYEAVTKGLDPNAEMKDSGIEWIGEIPKGWNIAKAGMLFKEFIRPYCKGDKPLSLSQQDGLVPTDEMKESSLKTASYDNWKRVYLDDLVLNRFKAHLGVFFASRYVGCVSFHYGVYHAIRSDVVPKYYEYLFHSPHYKSLFAQLSNGITVGLQNLSNRNFYSAYVHFPDYETQVEILDFLEKKCSELESLIVEKCLLIDDLEAYKKSLIYEVVTGKRRVC